MTELKSHPDLALRQHVEQVRSAARAIIARHSPVVVEGGVEQAILRAANLHDAGKSSAMFQEYIRDPKKYTGSKELKAHTPLSLLFTLLTGETWDALEVLSVALSVRGHHGQLPTLPGTSLSAPVEATDLTEFNNSKMSRILREQMAMLDVDAMNAALDLAIPADVVDGIQNSARKAIIRASVFLHETLLERWRRLDDPEKRRFRIRTQFVYSVLLEADKAFLAVTDPERYLNQIEHAWDPNWVSNLLPTSKKVVKQGIDGVRSKVRELVTRELDRLGSEVRLYSLTAPTGIGKTLLAASWALALRRQREGHRVPQIIVVLPFLSIIDQTVSIYQKLLLQGGMQAADKSWLLPAHSLADRDYGPDLEEQEETFFIDTWRSDVIITTYDQFLMAMFDDRGRYQMRFHHLSDALIIMDEVQSLPSRLWLPMSRMLETLAELSETRVLLMSATLPAIIPSALPLLPDYKSVFQRFSRYALRFDLNSQPLEQFISDHILTRVLGWVKARKRVLITLNTRASARAVYQALREWIDHEDQNRIPLYFITADVTPKDRLSMIANIRGDQPNDANDGSEGLPPNERPCIVVSTQTVEAGVDIDMTLVIRDFAPWDSLVQIAGRCNREGKRTREMVEIFSLVNTRDRAYAAQVYDPVRLDLTRKIIADASEITEEETLARSQAYFDGLAAAQDTGLGYLEQYLNFRRRDAVHEVLRGKERRQHTFVVLQEDPDLQVEAQAAQAVQERWQRRERWRQLAGRIAAVSIQVWARPGFNPGQIADPWFGDLWALRDGYYHADSGLDIQGDTSIW